MSVSVHICTCLCCKCWYFYDIFLLYLQFNISVISENNVWLFINFVLIFIYLFIRSLYICVFIDFFVTSMYNVFCVILFVCNKLSTIPDKISGTKWGNPVKLERKKKACICFCVFFNCYWKSLSSWRESRNWALEIF